MSNNENVILRDKTGAPIPQYYDPVAGVFKPITKDNYDPQVKTELELIKQQQSEILQRLNQPIDTQVTGSSVEFKNVIVRNDESLEAGQIESNAE